MTAETHRHCSAHDQDLVFSLRLLGGGGDFWVGILRGEKGNARTGEISRGYGRAPLHQTRAQGRLPRVMGVPRCIRRVHRGD